MEKRVEKRVLIGIDGSSYALNAVEYAANMFKNDPVFTMSLIYISPPLPPILLENNEEDADFTNWQVNYRSRLERKSQEKAKKILDKARQLLLDLGWTENRFETIHFPGRFGPARDLFFYAEHGLFDALVLGRRGVSLWEKLTMGSTADKIIHAEKTVPIWMVGNSFFSPKVLLAIDGSENSIRAVDHAGFILSGMENIEVTIFHVLTMYPLEEIKDLSEKWEKVVTSRILPFMDKAEEMLVKAGVPARNIRKKIKKSHKDVAGEIINYQKQENIGTIVIGRRGLSCLKAFFLGSVSTKVLNMVERGAVWIVD
ncbi:MAG: universal stress protein [Candidatus Desulfofervidaceae bacterium]|nr:universal stress protein [Candidatus Desulfofervidaceae bacterium]